MIITILSACKLLPVPAAQVGNQAQQPGLVVGYDLHSHGAWLCLPDGGGGREQSADSGAPSGAHAEGRARGRGAARSGWTMAKHNPRY